ncbi:MAG TPA: HDIG domain-containing protein [Gemmatimonadales bacterium]|nr:HDIG domain-containing protein [Gemmatimonadales bacterium]
MRLPTRDELRYHAERWAWVPALAILTFLAFPSSAVDVAPMLEPGKVAPRDVIAPFTYSVSKSDQELAREAADLAGTVQPIYDYSPRTLDSSTTAARALFAKLDAIAPHGADAITAVARTQGVLLTPLEAAYLASTGKRRGIAAALQNLFAHTLAVGTVAQGVLQGEASSTIVVRRGTIETAVPRDQVMAYGQYLAVARRYQPDPGSAAAATVFVRLAARFYRPTLVPDPLETEHRRDELRRSVDPTKYVVRAGDRIVAAHSVVTSDAKERLVALQQELVRRGAAANHSLAGAVGPILLDALVIGVFWALLLFYRRETYRELRQVALAGCLFATSLLGAAAVARWAPTHPELIPLPLAAMMLTVLFSGRVSMIAAMILASVIGLQPVFHDTPAMFFSLIGGVTAALSIRVLRRRSHLFIVVLMVGAGYFAGAVAIGLANEWTVADVFTTALGGIVNGLVSAGLALLLLPLAEWLTHITTDLSLLELSDPSRPLLRRLALEAPGTYAHSIAMANLVEAACNRVGANGLLGRVGCYYHDVGKVKNALSFVENQARGTNPHDRLDPRQSAAIIRAHVPDGLALAAEAGLPAVVAAFIPEHHGTSEITYFLDRARRSGGVARVADFTYPGPKPRSVETAITMVADSVEAALRVLDDPTQQKIEEAIDHIVRTKLNQGQLDDAPITLEQINLVKAEFVRAIAGMYHNRIDYPESSGGISASWQPAARH